MLLKLLYETGQVMFAEYMQGLYEQLIINKFEPIKGISDGIIDENTEFMGFINYNSASWYAVMVINMKEVGYAVYDNILSVRINNYFEDILKKNNKKNIVVLNLLIGGNGSGYEEFFERDLFTADGSVINAYWEINLDNKTLKPAKNNPDKILNLREIVMGLLQIRPSEAGGEPVYSEQVYENALKKRPVLKVIGGTVPYLTYVLIIINLLVSSVIEIHSSNGVHSALRYGGLVPAYVKAGEVYRLVTSLFIHLDILHLVNNCLSLFIFGSRVEKYYGKTKFLIIYLLSGIAGGIVSVMFSKAISAGASGGVFGLAGAVLALTFKSKLDASGLDYTTMLALAGTSLGMGFLHAGVNNYAHGGGLVAGILLGFILYSKSMRVDNSGYKNAE